MVSTLGHANPQRSLSAREEVEQIRERECNSFFSPIHYKIFKLSMDYLKKKKFSCQDDQANGKSF